MYITIDVDPCVFDDDLTDIHIYKHSGKFVKQIAFLTGIPRYQSEAIRKALKDADPGNYKPAQVFKLVPKTMQERFNDGDMPSPELIKEKV